MLSGKAYFERKAPDLAVVGTNKQPSDWGSAPSASDWEWDEENPISVLVRDRSGKPLTDGSGMVVSDCEILFPHEAEIQQGNWLKIIQRYGRVMDDPPIFAVTGAVVSERTLKRAQGLRIQGNIVAGRSRR